MQSLFKKILEPTTVNKVASLAPLGSIFGIRSLHTSNALEAVPKKRTSHRRTRIKWKNRMFMTPQTHNHACTNCGTWTRNYNICGGCGWYDGKPVTSEARAKFAAEQEKAKNGEVTQNPSA
jgi:ribosomal protein L32